MDFAAIIDHLGSDHNMRRDREYSGQPHCCDGIRGSELIQGLTVRDIRDCFVRAFVKSHPTFDEQMNDIQPNRSLYHEAEKGEHAVICENDLYELKGNFDPMALCQNLMCEIERMMGIFPNVPELHFDDEDFC